MVLLVSMLFYFASVVWTIILALSALGEILMEQSFPVGNLLQAAVSVLPGGLFGIYVLVKANLFPLGRKGGTPRRKARRLLDTGVVVGIPIQIIVVGGYLADALLPPDAGGILAHVPPGASRGTGGLDH